MPQLRIERVPIQTLNLGWLGGDHMHLALEQDYDIPQDLWFVIEGTRDSGPNGRVTLGVEGWDGTTTLSHANGGLTGDALTEAIGTPAWRGSRVIPISGDGYAVWDDIASYAGDFEPSSFRTFLLRRRSARQRTSTHRR